MLAEFIVNGEVIARGNVSHDDVHGQPFPPDSFAYVCPFCGDVWAKVKVEGRPFVSWLISCESHPPPYAGVVAGSLWLGWDRAFNLCLPREVLVREVEMHIKHFEREEI